jgi:uncharacterized membrane protein YdjX (TVP38/TMEM64 family)
MTRAPINRLLVLTGIVVFAVLFRMLPVTEWLDEASQLYQRYPVAVPAAYVAAVTVATVALFPGWISMMLGGLLLRLQALDEAVNAQSFYIVVLTRFAIVLPFNVLNYAFGLTRVTGTIYVAATALGMLPAVLLYVYLGTLADDFGEILAGDVRPDSSTYWIAAVAIVVIAAVVWIVQRAARRALQQKQHG